MTPEMPSKQPLWGQLIRFKRAWLLILLISTIIFINVVYRAVLITDQPDRSSTNDESESSDENKGETKGAGFEDHAETRPKDVQRTEEDDTSYSTVCRKPIPALWTKLRGHLLENVSFPDCSPLFYAIKNATVDEREWVYSDFINWTVPFNHSQNSVLYMVKNCDELHRRIDFPDKPGSEEEAEFPIAYVFMAYRNLAQTVRLFRMIYQPQNAYCINYDTKSGTSYKEAVISIASCFPNVYLNPKPEPIHYGKFSVLSSTMECLKVLRKSAIKWRYVQIVSWNDFPLKTNWEMVQIFKILNGSQDAELTENDQPTFLLYESAKIPHEHTAVRRPVPPDGITIYKGSFATTMTREFIDFIFTDPVSIGFYDYFKYRSIVPHEFYWISVIHNTQLNPPGAFPGQCFLYYNYTGKYKPFLSRYQVWEFRIDAKAGKVCEGEHVHFSCVYGVRDLQRLMERMELMAHKVYEEFQPAALYCLEEWYWQRACMGKTDLNMSFYENLPTVKYQNLSPSEKRKYVCTL